MQTEILRLTRWYHQLKHGMSDAAFVSHSAPISLLLLKSCPNRNSIVTTTLWFKWCKYGYWLDRVLWKEAQPRILDKWREFRLEGFEFHRRLILSRERAFKRQIKRHRPSLTWNWTRSLDVITWSLVPHWRTSTCWMPKRNCETYHHEITFIVFRIKFIRQFD